MLSLCFFFPLNIFLQIRSLSQMFLLSQGTKKNVLHLKEVQGDKDTEDINSVILYIALFILLSSAVITSYALRGQLR